MANVSVGILGLGRLGASVGLALKRHNRQGGQHKFTISGYDASASSVKAAKKLSAVDQVGSQPEQMARDRDIVFMALPYAEVQTAYELIAPSLRPGAVIVDMSSLKQPSLDWARKNLPENVHIVCAAPVVNPRYLFEGTDETSRASEDYFDQGTMMLMPSVNCITEAISLASDLSEILGARPHFYDPNEHDALIASTEALPSLLGMVYFYTLSQRNGWGDIQRLTNPAFGMLSRHLFDTHPDDLSHFWMDSSSHLLRYLDEMIASLRDFRALIADEERDALDAALANASSDYETWINRRHNNRWEADEKLSAETPTFGGVMGNMFGGALAGRLRRDKKDKD
jgi:prephenate dehydrogenase